MSEELEVTAVSDAVSGTRHDGRLDGDDGRGLPPVRSSYRRYYERYHDGSAHHFELMASGYERKLRRLLDSVQGSSSLEIGCGGGFCLEALLRLRAAKVEGIDADAGQSEACRARGLPASHVPIEAFPIFARARDKAFQHVLMFDVLEHISGEARLGFLRDTLAMLEPGGTLVCQVPNANSVVASRYRYNDATHWTSFTEVSLDFELYRAGFDDIHIEDADPLERPGWRRPRDMLRWGMQKVMRNVVRRCYDMEIGSMDAWKMPLGPNIIALARRGGA